MVAEGTGPDGADWRRAGRGQVTVHPSGLTRIEWRESGYWQEQGERPTSFRNQLRWTWDLTQGTLQLQHLRRGADRPVHLVDLTPDGPHRFTSAAAHLCGPDRYQAEMTLSDGAIELRWAVMGPEKRYSLSTTYFP